MGIHTIEPVAATKGRNGGTYVVKELSPYLDFGPNRRGRKHPRFGEFRYPNALITEIANSSDVRNYEPAVVKAGRNGGTYVVKELV